MTDQEFIDKLSSTFQGIVEKDMQLNPQSKEELRALDMSTIDTPEVITYIRGAKDAEDAVVRFAAIMVAGVHNS